MAEFMTTLPQGPSKSDTKEVSETTRYHSPKPTRRSDFKVRTGCITCKKRHIKCDETKPHCNNCLRSRSRHCEGYAVRPKKKAPGPVQLCWDARQDAHSAVPSTQVPQSVGARDFDDPMAMLYFQEFVGLVRGPWISAASNSELWEVTLPQLARNNNTLRCIAIAIGALKTCHTESTRQTLRTVSMLPRSTDEDDVHYLCAVKYYCRALKLLRQNPSVQDTVFISVLLLFFEVLRGNRKAALSHLNHSLALMLALLTDDNAHHYLLSLAPNPKPLLFSVAGILMLLVPQARFVLHGTAGQDRPLPNFTRGLKNNGLSMESFMVLLSQLTRKSPASDRFPSEFSNLGEFEEHWTDVRCINSAVGPMAMKIVLNSGVLGSKEEDVINQFFHTLLGNPEIERFCKSSRQAMQALDAAFLPLFNKIVMSETQSPTYLKALHLRLQFLQVYAFENPPQYLSAERLYSQTPLFREYLSLARVALRIFKQDISSSACRMSLECGIAGHLLLVAFFCRDPLIRDEAVQMLGEYPCQDGLWNVQALYTLALKSQAVERTNALEGTSTEQWRRLWRREYVFEDGGDRIVFRYMDKHDASGGWQMVEEVADVGGSFDTIHWMRRPLTGFGTLIMGDMVSF